MEGNVILVVEDDLDSRELIRTILETLLGVRTVSAATGKEALDRALELRPSLILLDLMLPEIGGIDVARWLKSNETTKDIPIIALTGLCTAMDEARQAGFDDCVEKPFDLEPFLRKVRRFLLPPEHVAQAEPPWPALLSSSLAG